MKRGYKQNRMRSIWKSIKTFYEIAENETEFYTLCENLYYSGASADVEGMQEYIRIVKAVVACQ
jgi:hypothetical protein